MGYSSAPCLAFDEVTREMWTVIRMVKGGKSALELEGYLIQAGIMCKKKPVYKNVSENDNYYELKVLPSEVDAANEILIENGV